MLLVRDDLYITSSSFQEEGGGELKKVFNLEKDVEDENFGACLKMVRI